MSNLFSGKNRTLRIFISSTFQDMMSERELLIKQVFPELRSYCLNRQVSLIEVDLRWGITTEEAMSGKVIEYCMNEIDKSRPYFLCIIGNRYGWRPQEEEIKKNKAIIEKYPWVAKDIKSKLSITNMEVLYGALRKHAVTNNAFFYLKAWSNEKIGMDQDEISLNQMRREIFEQKQFPVKIYNNTEELHHNVLIDFKHLIDQEFPIVETPSMLEKDRFAHVIFAKLKSEFYIEQEQLKQKLFHYITKGGKPLLLKGNNGEGLSTVLSHFLVEYNDLHPEEFIFFHFTSISYNDCLAVTILKRLYREIYDQFEVYKELPETEEAFIADLPELLGKVGTKGCIIMIDDADRIIGEGGKGSLYWLPHEFSPFIKIIFTAHDNGFSEEWSERGFEVYELTSFSKLEALAFIRKYLGKYCKKLNNELEELILEAKWMYCPQLLRSLLDELRIFGLHEGIESQIRTYTSCGKVEDFYDTILARFEFDYGNTLVKRVYCLIYLSKLGFQENELVELSGIPRLEFTPLLNALSTQLEQYGGSLCFRNEYLKNAVKDRYLCEASYVISLRKQIVSFYEREPNSVAALRELPYQYIQLGMFMRLKNYLMEVKRFNILYQYNSYDLLSYWSVLKTKFNIDKVFRNTYKNSVFSEETERVCFINNAASFLSLNDSYGGALYFYKQALTYTQNLKGRIAELKGLIGIAYRKMSKYQSALKYLKEALNEQKSYYGDYNIPSIETNNELANIYTVKGEHEKALKFNFAALACCKNTVGDNHKLTASTYHEIGWDYEYIGDYKQALSYQHQAKKIYIELYGKEHLELIPCYHSLAWIYDWFCDYHNLMKYAERAYYIAEKYVGKKHSLTGMSYKLLAVGNYRAGNYKTALENNKYALNIFLEIYGRIHTRISVQYFQIGMTLLKMKCYEEGEENFRKSIDMDIELLGNVNGGDFAISYNYYGKALFLQGKFEEGIEYIRKALDLATVEYGEVCYDASDSYYFLGSAYYLQSKYEKSKELLDKAVTIREKVLGKDNVDTAIVYKALAMSLRKLNQVDGAEKYALEATKIFDKYQAQHLDNEEV